ncbi:hypothetical protein ABIB62_000147 [Mucilaginibacter sp. UYP25]|uniref:DUF5672 family protein n=1 Tax=unclassified Mucilaginibacter TaxID=2617802 RepID=UPI003398B5B0
MTGTKEKVAILIPFYKDSITEYEILALKQSQKILGDFPIIAIKPNWLQLTDEVKEYLTDIISFDDQFFANVPGYNALMTDSAFYKTFLNYEYILIYQLDAFVFKNTLNYWCSRGYDYVGAPWMNYHDYPDVIKTAKSNLKKWFYTRFNILKDGLPSPLQFENRVGNGGFSLRRVDKFYKACLKMKEEIAYYNTRHEYQFGEDVFWSVEVNRKGEFLKIPSYKIAVGFSLEQSPERGMRILKGELPFGCHAWDRDLPFWRPVFKTLGYDI